MRKYRLTPKTKRYMGVKTNDFGKTFDDWINFHANDGTISKAIIESDNAFVILKGIARKYKEIFDLCVEGLDLPTLGQNEEWKNKLLGIRDLAHDDKGIVTVFIENSFKKMQDELNRLKQ